MHDTSLKLQVTAGDRNRRLRESSSIQSRNRALQSRSRIVRLPVRTLRLTQTGPGSEPADWTAAASWGVHLLRARVTNPSVCVTLLERAYTSFSIARPLDGALQVNGDVARPGSIYTPVESEGVYTSGGAREMTTAFVRRDSFSRVVAALWGVAPEDVQLDNLKLELTHAKTERLRVRLYQLITEYVANPDGQATHRITDEVFGLLADAYLMTDLRRGGIIDRVRRAHRIVRNAEDRFAAAREERISLADLCAAAGVSAQTLYRAFDIAVGLPPLEYFHKRRLTAARSTLLRSRPSRGAVKRAALEAGLTALGRFSVEYRQLFNESPSVTLARTR